MQAVLIPSAHGFIAATVFLPQPAAATGSGVLFIHGLHSSQAGYRPRAEAVARRLGGVALTFDLGGHGESEGDEASLSIAEHLDDAVAAYDRLAGEAGVDPGRIGVCGASYGAYLAALLTTRRRVARLALRAPALYSDADIDVAPAMRTGAGPSDAVPGALRQFEGPVLLVESGRDPLSRRTVPIYRAASASAEHILMEDAEHELRLERWRTEYLEHLIDFFGGAR